MHDASNGAVSFRETQKFQQLWIWVIILPIAVFLAGFFGYAMFEQLILHQPFGSRPMPDIGLAIVGTIMILFGIGLVYLFSVMRLETEVRGDGVDIKFFPLAHQKIPFNEIRNPEVVAYHPIRDYGGWGIRWGRKGKAYNVSGNRGVRLQLTNEKQLLIGSQRPEELCDAIKARL